MAQHKPATGRSRDGPARFDQPLAHARADNRPALAAYVPASWPTQAQNLRILNHLAEVTDVIELGWPSTFSDHVRDRITGELR
ncbi:hypothetical protein [Streptomyces sp. NPDC046859]|uniref:hypothetical protein n=1 Tax=Streptomyces sp. NPDC046859 TaxID=3155734 RepID=UPI0033E05885